LTEIRDDVGVGVAGVSIDCWDSTRDSGVMRLRSAAASSKRSASAAPSIFCSRSFSTSWWPPRRKRAAACTSREYASASTNPTQGPLQRWIWCSRQGRDRLAKTVSSQVRSRNTFCSTWMLSLTAQALGYGPKNWLVRSVPPR
jgi:hypothetical protein